MDTDIEAIERIKKGDKDLLQNFLLALSKLRPSV